MPGDNTSHVNQFLREAAWMACLPENVRERVCSEAYETTHGRNDVVAHRGEKVASWIGLREGLLKVSSSHRSGKVVMFAGIPRNAWFGEGSVLKREPRRYDVIAMAPSSVVHVPRATFVWLLETSFEFNNFIIQHLNERLSQYMATTETDRITDPVVRLARAISTLFNPVLYPATGPLLKISQEELGELAGLSRQRVNAALGKLQRAALLRIDYGGVVVLNLAGIKKQAELF